MNLILIWNDRGYTIYFILLGWLPCYVCDVPLFTRSFFCNFRLSIDKEQPYLSEAGVEVFDEMYLRYQKQLQLLDPSINKGPLIKLSMYQLVKNTLNMLIGIPSEIFILEEVLLNINIYFTYFYQFHLHNLCFSEGNLCKQRIKLNIYC